MLVSAFFQQSTPKDLLKKEADSLTLTSFVRLLVSMSFFRNESTYRLRSDASFIIQRIFITFSQMFISKKKAFEIHSSVIWFFKLVRSIKYLSRYLRKGLQGSWMDCEKVIGYLFNLSHFNNCINVCQTT